MAADPLQEEPDRGVEVRLFPLGDRGDRVLDQPDKAEDEPVLRPVPLRHRVIVGERLAGDVDPGLLRAEPVPGRREGYRRRLQAAFDEFTMAI